MCVFRACNNHNNIYAFGVRAAQGGATANQAAEEKIIKIHIKHI